MSTEQITLKIDSQRLAEAQALAIQTGASMEHLLSESLNEAIKMRRCPGIIFVDGPAGRRPVVTGGLEVWEIVEAWKGGCQGDFACLQETFHWLTEHQLRAALRYYELYPAEIDAWIEKNARAFEELRRDYPHLIGPR
jgi:uncharacterized protein (DUF433 family)